MHPEPRIEKIGQKLLVGIALEMSREEDQTTVLWRSFMPRRHDVQNRTTTDYLSMQVYPRGSSQVADPAARFTKWAVVEVDSVARVPPNMQSYTMAGGLYAVFPHRGPATDLSTVMYIYRQWLPQSSFLLDDREHFEVLPENYDPLDPSAEEEFWIPVRPA